MARRPHSYSPHTLDLIALMGLEIARARRARRLTAEDLATRAGVSRSTLHAVEHGSPTVAIGVVFEIAALVGLQLLNVSPVALADRLQRSRDRLALLPASVRHPPLAEDDNF